MESCLEGYNVYVFILLAVSLFLYWPGMFVNKHYDEYERIQKPRNGNDRVGLATLNGHKLVTEATAKPFILEYWAKDYVILPLKYLADVRRAKKEHLNFLDSISDVFFIYNWVGDLFKSNRMVYAVIKGLNPQLPKISHAMFEEIEYAFEEDIGLRNATTEILAVHCLSRITLRVMSRIIAGKELSRNQRFLEAATSYFAGNFLTGSIMLKIPLPVKLRDIIAWPLCKYHQYYRQKPVLEIIKPVIAKRIEAEDFNHQSEAHFDAVHCALRLAKDFPFPDTSAHSRIQSLSQETLQLVWAGGQSPALSLCTVIFKLLAHPQYLEPLRNEAQTAVSKHGWNDAIFNELPMMDSFIRETNRVQPSVCLNATRIIKHEPFTFSDGLILPVGTRIGFSVEGAHQNPDLVENPLEFDGFRFVKLAAANARQEDGVNRWAASHCSYSNLNFGYGNHACPGRFIVIRLMKAMLSRFILEYDFSWDLGTNEPPRYYIEGASVPNITQTITIRRRAQVVERQIRRS